MKPLRLFALGVFVVALAGLSYGQDAKTFPAIDQRALRTPASAEESVEKLAAYLTKPYKSDKDKARALFRWVSDRIRYDVDGARNRVGKDPTYAAANQPDAVLKNRQAVCAGYAKLFVALCQQAGLEAVEVTGLSRHHSDAAAEPKYERHAWTAVKIDGQWRLCEPTWAAGSVNNDKFTKRYNDVWFLAPPEQMIFNHLPTDEKWQLAKTTLTEDEFKSQPRMDGALFEYGIQPKTIRTTVAGKKFRDLVKAYNFNEGKVTITKAPLDRYLKHGVNYVFEIRSPDIVDVIAQGGGGETVHFLKGRNGYTATIVPPPGTLKIAGRVSLQENRYIGILEYTVE